MAGWPYPCHECVHFRRPCHCSNYFWPYCLILYLDHDEAFREVVRKYGLNKDEATALIMKFMGYGVCMKYEPVKKPEKIRQDILEKATRELEEKWLG